ncbi:MAG: glycosyltransferase [Chitinophagaceae bacterium]
MKHILWLASWYPDEMSPYNGDFIQRHALAVSQYLPVTVIYLAQHGPEVEMQEEKAVKLITGQLTEITVYFPYQKSGRPLFDKIRYNWKYFYHYRKFLRDYLAENGKPDLIHVHIPMKAGRMALWLKNKFGIPYFVTEHSSAYSEEVPDNYHTRNSYYRKWVKAIFEGAEAVTTVSQKLGDRLQELFTIRKMHIIPNVADTRFFYYDGNAVSRSRFLHASTMDHPKNVEGILRTLHALKNIRQDWECIMLGWDTPALKQLCSQLQLNDHVKWKGVVPYRQVAVEMQHASALVMFSRYENLPCVILESLCCGLPVVSTRVGGIPEVIHEGNGILTEPGNEEQLLQALITCLNEPERYNRAAIAAAANDQFSYEAVGKMFEEVYEES